MRERGSVPFGRGSASRERVGGNHRLSEEERKLEIWRDSQ
jgi:hypothetical protein